MAITDSTLSNAWDAWGKIWDPKDRDPGAYKFALKDLTDEQFKEAARLALSECRFFPTPYDIRRLAPPVASQRAQAHIPSGYVPFGSLEVGELRQHLRRSEAWFQAVQAATEGSDLIDADGGERISGPASGENWLGVVKKLLATQYLLTKREINLRESFEGGADGTQRTDSAILGVLGTEGGNVEHLLQTATRPVVMRPYRNPSIRTTNTGTEYEPGERIDEEEEDAPSS